MKRLRTQKKGPMGPMVIRFLVVLLLLSACQPFVQPISPAPVNDQLVTATITESSSTPTPIPSVTPETPATQTPEETTTGDLLEPFNRTGNNPMSPMEKLLLNALELQLAMPLPDHPQQVTLYRRKPETLTEAGANALFQQLGMDGPVSSRTAEAGNAIFTASGQGYTMNIDSDSPPFFVLGRSDPMIEPGKQPFEDRKQFAEIFLQAHHLPDFSYRIEPVYGPYERNNVIAVAQQIDDTPLYQGQSPWIWLAFDEQGQLLNMVFQELQLVPDGQVTLRPVRDVWADLQGHRLEGRAMLRMLSNEEWQGDPAAQQATIDHAELAYFAVNTGGMWVGSIPADSSLRMVQPVWRFTGKLNDSTPLEILAEAIDSKLGETRQPAGSAGEAALDETQRSTGTVNTEEDSVNVRSGPGAIYDRIAGLSKGQTITITGRSPSWDWFRIRTDTIEGWVYSAFLTIHSVTGIPCVEQQAGDCASSGLPKEHEQAVARIQALMNQNDLPLTFRGQESNPNADLRSTLLYFDDQGSEYWVDQATLQVVQWTPNGLENPGSARTVEALRTIALDFAVQQSPRIAQNANSLNYTETTKDGSIYAFRWEDQSDAGHSLFPFLQLVLRSDGQVINYHNTLDLLTGR